MAAPKEARKLRREFRRKGYWAVYHEVNGYPPGKRELAHEWLRQREIASDRRDRWMIFAFITVSIAAIIAAYFAAVPLYRPHPYLCRPFLCPTSLDQDRRTRAGG